MGKNIKERLQALRRVLDVQGVKAFIVPSTDPHLSEYTAPHWKAREWISGFTGSAGTVVVLPTEAGLWTDSRYFLQAAAELEGSGITLHKEGIPGTPSVEEFLCQTLRQGDTVGIDGKLFSVLQAEKLNNALNTHGIRLAAIGDPIEEIWTDRPPMPQSQAYVYELKYAGKTAREKINALRKEMRKAGAESLLISALDEIAWTLNLRGNDVHCNPVVVSYLMLTQNEAFFFIDPRKVTAEVSAYLKEQGVTLREYAHTERFLQSLPANSVLLDPAKTNYAVCKALPSTCKIVRADSPVAILKAVRNPQEIAGIHEAMKRDGVALVRFLMWLQKNVPTGNVTELGVAHKLHECRAAQSHFMGESFDTIAGYKEHGAIVHYSATPQSNATLRPEGFLLVDTGGQYLDGTTDITRTIALGRLTEEERVDYTLVLKGHIALAMARFPEGTRGAQLDVLARMPLWQHKMNFLHGTGHGVGHFLNVHEGPQSIRMNENPVPLLAGMVTSNEPGVYKAGSHGIRTENLLLTCPYGEGMFGKYLHFETLTLCPICKKGIIREMMENAEVEWLNSYHKRVYDTLAPLLTEDEKKWLLEATTPI